jgi:hypothetical protein
VTGDEQQDVEDLVGSRHSDLVSVSGAVCGVGRSSASQVVAVDAVVVRVYQPPSKT